MYDSTRNIAYSPSITDIDISEDGCINCLDYTTGRIFQYDEECNLLFITGARSNQLGGFTSAAAVESLGERLYVVDSVKDTVTVFRETSFGAAVHKATSLYNDGYYEEALEPWYEVLRRDGNYRRANIGVASALLRKGDYKGAMKYAKRGGSPDIYNEAFEGWRREFIKRNFPYITAGIIALIAAAKLLRRRRRKLSAAEKETGKEAASP
jgi:tetratricopeptide (TPR) repeat protein